MTPQPLLASTSGRMTAVMRSLAVASGARIPRIAVLRDGRILDEHLVRDATSVTIGRSERARIVVRGAADIPESFMLLECAGDRYWLRFTDAMRGRITGTTGIRELADLRGVAHVVDGAYRLPLPEDARGRVSFGATTILFQLVPAPPAPLRPRLPLGVKEGLSIDFRLTLIVAMSFLVHFGLAGAMYSDWMDPVVDTDRGTVSFVDDLARLPHPPPEPTNERSSEPSTGSETSPPAAPQRTMRSVPAPVSRRPTGDSEAVRLAKEAEALEIDLLASKSRGPAVKEALDGRNVPAIDLEGAAKRNIGMTHEQRELKVAGNEPIQKHDTNLALIGTTKSNASNRAGNERTTDGPAINIDVRPPQTSVAINNADAVVASLRPRFRRCYESALANDPTIAGKTTILAKIAPNGTVQSVETGATQGLPPSVTACLANVVSRAEFNGNGALTTLSIPITVVRQ